MINVIRFFFSCEVWLRLEFFCFPNRESICQKNHDEKKQMVHSLCGTDMDDGQLTYSEPYLR